MFKLLGIVSIPWRSRKPMDHTGFNINTDMEFDTVFSSALPFDPDVVPGAAVVSTEPAAVNSDVHLFSSEKPGHPVHHLAYIGDGKSFHTALDHAMSWKNRTVLSEGFTVFYMCFYTIVGLIESYLENTTDCYGLWVVSFSPSVIRFPGWRQLVYRFDHRFGEIGGEVAVHMVRNFWINPFLCTSHPLKR